MGYDMYLIKADKRKLRDMNDPYWGNLNEATIDEVNSYYPVLREFYNDRDDLSWRYEEYNLISEKTLSDIITWLSDKIAAERFMSLDPSEERMTKMVYNNIKDWVPLSENEAVYFEEDS